MIEIVKTPTANVLYSLIQSSNNEVVLCAPYIKNNIVSDILKHIKEDVELTVITSSNFANFLQKSSDIEAIELLIDNNVKVMNYQHLHAKIYLFDLEKVLITSANLTHSGLNINYEYGVLIENDLTSITKVKDDFNTMLDSDLCGEFNSTYIKYINDTINLIKEEDISTIDDNEDMILTMKDYSKISSNMSAWQKDVF
ncbi:MAG: phospholipase D family protein [Anaeroplasmataceae bacterium]